MEECCLLAYSPWFAQPAFFFVLSSLFFFLLRWCLYIALALLELTKTSWFQTQEIHLPPPSLLIVLVLKACSTISCSACFLVKPRTTNQFRDGSTCNGWVLLHQSLIKEMLCSLSTAQSCRGVFSIGAPSSQMTRLCQVDIKKAYKRTWKGCFEDRNGCKLEQVNCIIRRDLGCDNGLV